jgi:hypothetical protein
MKLVSWEVCPGLAGRSRDRDRGCARLSRKFNNAEGNDVETLGRAIGLDVHLEFANRDRDRAWRR